MVGIITVALILLGYFLYERIMGTTTLRVNKDQLEMMKEMVGIKLDEIQKKKQEIIDNATKEGKTVSLSSLAESFGRAKAKYQGPDKATHDAYIDDMLKEFGRKIRAGDTH